MFNNFKLTIFSLTFCFDMCSTPLQMGSSGHTKQDPFTIEREGFARIQNRARDGQKPKNV